MLTFKVISTCCNKYKQHITANHYLPNGKTTYAAMMYVLWDVGCKLTSKYMWLQYPFAHTNTCIHANTIASLKNVVPDCWQY